MKQRLITLAMALLAANATPHALRANESDSPTRVEIPVEALLAPYFGFEEKNNIQVVLYGLLPNNCYTLDDTTTEKLDEHTFRIRQFALHDQSGLCADESTLPIHMKMTVPFTQEVSIGHLGAGTYRFEYTKAGAGDAFRSLSVASNVTPTTDTLPYAAVSAVQARDMVDSLNHLVVTLTGLLNSTCTTLDPNVKIMREGDVLVLLPTIQVRHDVLCAQIMVPFQKRVDLGQIPPGIHLVQARSMNGKAVNKIVNVMK